VNQAYVLGAGNTAFGRLEGRGPLDLMAEAAERALTDAGLARGAIDGVLCGYATTLPHLMLSTLFCERASPAPAYAHSVLLGGATGGAMVMLARELVRGGRCENVLVVAGEEQVEVATFREDLGIADGRHPAGVRFADAPFRSRPLLPAGDRCRVE